MEPAFAAYTERHASHQRQATKTRPRHVCRSVSSGCSIPETLSETKGRGRWWLREEKGPRVSSLESCTPSTTVRPIPRPRNTLSRCRPEIPSSLPSDPSLSSTSHLPGFQQPSSTRFLNFLPSSPRAYTTRHHGPGPGTVPPPYFRQSHPANRPKR